MQDSDTNTTEGTDTQSTDQRSTTAVIYDAIETLSGEREEAPVGMVVTRAITTGPYGLADILDELNRLIINGELYQPQEVTIRPTEPAVMADGGTDPGKMADWASADAVGTAGGPVTDGGTDADDSEELSDADAAALLEGVMTAAEPALGRDELADLDRVLAHLRGDSEDIPVVVEEGDA